MSIHAQISEEAKAALAAQKRVSSISSIVIAILACFLLGLILFVIAMTVEVKNPPQIISYNPSIEETQTIDKPEVTNEVVKPPSAPSMSMARVIASSSSANVSVPNPVSDVEAPSLDFSAGDDFGEGFDGAGWGEGAGAAAASFFGQKVEAQRIAYVIDYSMSMKGKGRDELMRKELTKAIKELPSSMDYQMIYFAGPAWVAGEKLDVKSRKAGVITADGGRKYDYGPGEDDWRSRSAMKRAQWLKASSDNVANSLKHVKNTPLIFGTAWEVPLEMALSMEPAPDVIYFMTDGVGGDVNKVANEMSAKAKELGTKINTIAMMEPSAQGALTILAKNTGGAFTIVEADGKRKQVIKGK
ncbi:hypothetical protein ACFPK9_03170 [Rubritalea spongiae]|uniref:VWFA domain-containing protein n=1 Tax=Rubritalea spongiae TaxID=430797 RepID=A0ABW5E5X2_9BACT